MSQVEKEIREQPEALERLLNNGREAAEEVAARVRAFAPRFVVFAARGSSDNAARYAQYLFGIRNRLPVCMATPSLFTCYETAPSLAGALVVGVSQSAVSHHLRQLRKMRIVTYRKSGRMAYYRLDDDHIAGLFRAGLEHVRE